MIVKKGAKQPPVKPPDKALDKQPEHVDKAPDTDLIDPTDKTKKVPPHDDKKPDKKPDTIDPTNTHNPFKKGT